MSLRTPESQAIYKKHIQDGGLKNGCPLCAHEPRTLFRFWKIMPNKFPYDKIAEKHDMLVPLRHVTESEFTSEEIKELKEIKDDYLNTNYEYIIEAAHKNKTIPAHFHLHLLTVKAEHK